MFGSHVYSHLPDSDLDVAVVFARDPGCRLFHESVCHTAALFNKGFAAAHGRVCFTMEMNLQTATVFLRHGSYKVDFTYKVAGQNYNAHETTQYLSKAIGTMRPEAKIAARTVVDWAKHVTREVYVDHRDSVRGDKPKGCHMYMVLPAFYHGGLIPKLLAAESAGKEVYRRAVQSYVREFFLCACCRRLTS